MINVVTIDFDVIMSPSIGFYNDLVGMSDPIGKYIDEFSFVANLPANLYQYEYLTKYLMMAQKSVQDIYFISSHEKVIDILRNMPHDEEICLINIDHHHDVGYSIDNWRSPLKNPEVGNWVKYGRDKKLFDHYYWIKNENSDDIPKEGKHYIDKEILFKNSKLEQYADQTDVLILCSSLEWIPPIYHPLFYTWQTICEEVNGKEYLVDNI